MRIDFINEIEKTTNIKRRDLLEKDLIIHLLLSDLSKNAFFSDNFAFKGGTCLIKTYLGYFRFSEDVDFTWINQKAFEGKSQKSVRTALSKTINKTGSLLEEITEKKGLDFKLNKNDKRYCEFGGGNKFCTFKIWYKSEILNDTSFIKMQINFIERICFPVKRKNVKSLIKKSEELLFLFPEYADYTKEIKLKTYDIREIFCEKIRAIITRKGIKARDFIDLYLIDKKFHFLNELDECTIQKINLALKLYNKYKTNFKEKINQLKSGEFFTSGEEQKLLISNINPNDFYDFLKKINTHINKIIENIER